MFISKQMEKELLLMLIEFISHLYLANFQFIWSLIMIYVFGSVTFLIAYNENNLIIYIFFYKNFVNCILSK